MLALIRNVILLVSVISSSEANESGVQINPNAEDPYRAYQNCMYEFGLDACQPLAKPGGTIVREYPKEDSAIIVEMPYGGFLLLTQSPKVKSDDAWMRIHIVDTRSRQQKEVFGWVKRSENILNSDFRRVTDCWPLAFMINPGDEYEGSYGWVQFTKKGIATGEPLEMYRFEYKDDQHVYYADGVFVVRHPLYDSVDLYGAATLDYPNRVVKYAGNVQLKGKKQIRWQPEKKLKHCTTVPVVSDEAPPIKRKPHNPVE